MRIPEYVISDLKDLNKNHLMAVGFAFTGFTVAYGVNRACRWFFQMQATDAKKMRTQFVELIAVGLGFQACFFLENTFNISKEYSSCTVNLRVLVLHIAAFALASIRDPKKIVRAGIGLSAASVCLGPIYMGAIGTLFGSFGAELKEYLR